MNIRQYILSLQYKMCMDLFSSVMSIKYANIKGQVLSWQAYKETGQRYSSDIDILVSRKNMNEFESRLATNGFCAKTQIRTEKVMMLSSSHQTIPWIKKTKGFGDIVIDLNFDIFWGEYKGKRIDIDEFLSDTIEMDIYGVKVKTLPPIKALIQLVLHHYKDMNSIFLLATRKSIKYDMFKDIYFLIKNNIDVISLDRLYEMGMEYEIVPYFFYVLYYTGQVFNDKILKPYIEAFRSKEGEALLNCYGLCDKERKEWKYDFKTRLETDNLYGLIQDDLTEKDQEKIAINKRIFMGVTE